MIRILPFLFLAMLASRCRTTQPASEYLLLTTDTINDRYGYVDAKKDVVIPFGRYDMCFTDTFRTYAIVHKKTGGFFAIDRNENELYEVYNFDNGPDYVEDGYFRIIENGKIGYAEASTGKIIIRPQYEAAFPFENGKAKVAMHAKKESNDEHSTWTSDEWMYIDKTGKIIQKIDNTLYDTELYSVMDSATGNINLDDYTDKILILKSRYEGIESDVTRPMLIFYGKADGSFTLIARNDSVVLAADEGGVFGDPYEDVQIGKGTFTVSHYGGSSWRWSRDITFQYSKATGKIYLHDDSGISFHTSDPETTTEIVTNKENFDILEFEKFRK